MTALVNDPLALRVLLPLRIPLFILLSTPTPTRTATPLPPPSPSSARISWRVVHPIPARPTRRALVRSGAPRARGRGRLAPRHRAAQRQPAGLNIRAHTPAHAQRRRIRRLRVARLVVLRRAARRELVLVLRVVVLNLAISILLLRVLALIGPIGVGVGAACAGRRVLPPAEGVLGVSIRGVQRRRRVRRPAARGRRVRGVRGEGGRGRGGGVRAPGEGRVGGGGRARDGERVLHVC